MAVPIGNVWNVSAWSDGVWAAGVWASAAAASPNYVVSGTVVKAPYVFPSSTTDIVHLPSFTP